MKKFDENYNEKSLALQGFHAIFSLIYPAKLGRDGVLNLVKRYPPGRLVQLRRHTPCYPPGVEAQQDLKDFFLTEEHRHFPKRKNRSSYYT